MMGDVGEAIRAAWLRLSEAKKARTRAKMRARQDAERTRACAELVLDELAEYGLGLETAMGRMAFTQLMISRLAPELDFEMDEEPAAKGWGDW